MLVEQVNTTCGHTKGKVCTYKDVCYGIKQEDMIEDNIGGSSVTKKMLHIISACMWKNIYVWRVNHWDIKWGTIDYTNKDHNYIKILSTLKNCTALIHHYG